MNIVQTKIYWVYRRQHSEDIEEFKRLSVKYDHNFRDGGTHGPEKIASSFLSETGVIEKNRFGRKCAWMHPPRLKYMRITELAPFPYVEFPFETTRSWTHKIGPLKNFGEWNGLEIKSSYNWLDSASINVGDKEYQCAIARGFAQSAIGESTLDMVYSKDLGFVRMDYIFYNGAKSSIKLLQMKETSANEITMPKLLSSPN